jgi:uncharacterized protein DUF4177
MEILKMKTKILWIVIAFVIAGMFLVGWTTRSQSTPTTWEYKVVYTNMPFSQSELNQQATDGWQFVTCESYNQAHQVALIYKRAK